MKSLDDRDLSDTLILDLNGLAVDCIIGDLPEERLRAQRLLVDVRLTISACAAETDELADTVDYAALSDRMRGALVRARCRLIERAARIVCEVALEDPRVSAVVATVTKSGSVSGLASASVTFRIRRAASMGLD